MELYWDEAPIHVIDFEGGLQCGIVEYGIVTIKGSSIESVATRFCHPRFEHTYDFLKEKAAPMPKGGDRNPALMRPVTPMHFKTQNQSLFRSVYY